MVRDADAGDRLVDTMIRTVRDQGVLDTLATNVAQMALRDSAHHIVDEVMKLV